MGILVDGLAISFGALLGSLFKSKVVLKRNDIFGIGILIISAVGIIENLFGVSSDGIKGDGVLIVVGALILGYTLGEMMKLETRILNMSQKDGKKVNAFVDAVIFFGIGGLQICGPILLAMQNDSSQLYIKGLIDFPFALMFGAIYGYAVMLAAIPVAFVQIAIAVSAYFLGDFISVDMLSQICSIGYIILFFSGFNMLCSESRKISCVNMLPSILLAVIWSFLF